MSKINKELRALVPIESQRVFNMSFEEICYTLEQSFGGSTTSILATYEKAKRIGVKEMQAAFRRAKARDARKSYEAQIPRGVLPKAVKDRVYHSDSILHFKNRD